MGGQASVFYGAAQVSKDIDLVLLADTANFQRLGHALEELGAERIAVPPFDPGILNRGHAVHFRCHAPGVEDLRLDVMTRLRGVADFTLLWERRTVIGANTGEEFNLLSIPDLVAAKKTQRTKDWPIIELLVTIHFRENREHPAAEHVSFWLREARTPELLAEVARRFPAEAGRESASRPLIALVADFDELRAALDAEVRAEQAKDRQYWAPLRAELEQLRREERTKK
jgi:hypothetical protein